MIKKTIGVMILIPVAFVLGFWAVNIVTGILTGELDIIQIIVNHRVILAMVAAYIIFRYANPFKKKD